MSLKDAFSNLSLLPWSSVPTDKLDSFLNESFAYAELLLNSVPLSTSPPSTSDASVTTSSEQTSQRATKASETLAQGHPNAIDERNTDFQKQWGKPIKLTAKENPLNVSVYKLAASDRHGAWFARRSVHRGLDFTQWKHAARREFVESAQVKGGPGAGAVRGIAAERRLEKEKVQGLGTVEVWQLSSAFPGPVTPREFVAMLLSSDNALSEASSLNDEPSSENIPRHFVLISRPTSHDNAELNKQLVQGTYESVEMIREIPEGEGESIGNVVEWIMVTRSDPGGGIPKFMVERGTPGSIVADVPKFIEWAIHIDELPEWNEDEQDPQIEEKQNQAPHEEPNLPIENWKTATTTVDTSFSTRELSEQESTTMKESQQGNSTLLGNLSSTIGSTIYPYLPSMPYNRLGYRTNTEGIGGVDEEEVDNSSSSLSEAASTSSDATFASAPELRSGNDTERPRSPISLNSSELKKETSKPSNSHEKELIKLNQRRSELDARFEKARADDAKKQQEIQEKEEQESAKAQVRRERERKKAEERYRREIEKLDERRRREEEKAEQARIKEEKRLEERQRKARDKDVLARTQRERDEARQKLETTEQENDVMRSQIEELQRENTTLVQKLGAFGEAGLEAVKKIRDESSLRSRASSRSHRSGESRENLES